MPVNSKNKGSNFERTIAKDFTKWWNDAGLEGKFFRTPGSGALAYREQEDVIGDLCTPKGFPFTIECKNQEGWKLEDLFSEKIECNTDKGSISGWWKQSCIEAYRANKKPMLIVKRNFYDPLVIIPIDSISHILKEEIDQGIIPVVRRLYNVATEEFEVYYKVYVLKLYQWFERTDPNKLLSLQNIFKGGC